MINDMMCCGVRELDGLRESAPEIIGAMLEEAQDEIHPLNRRQPNLTRFRYAIFTDISTSRNGIRLAEYIRRRKLGKVIATTWNINPNTGRKVKVWTWTLDDKKLKAWWEKNKEED